MSISESVGRLPRPAVADRARSRVAVCLLFATMGSVLGSWAARVPDLQHRTGLDDRGWGLVATASTAGSLVSLLLVASVVGKVGARRLAGVGALLLAVVAPLAALSTSGAMLATGLFCQGFSANVLSAPMNAQAVTVERAYGRRIMASFHAWFSCGQLLGGALGAFAAHVGVSPAAQLAVTDVVLVGLLLATSGWRPQDVGAEPETRGGGSLLRDVLTVELGLLAALGFLESFVEGATSQWSAIFTATVVGAGAAGGATAFTCLATAGTVSRMLGDRVVNRFGAPAFLRGAACLAAAGLALALTAHAAAVAFLGFALFGLATGCVLPTVFGLAGRVRGVAPARGVSVVVLGQWPAFLLAPPLIGVLSGAVGLRHALALLLLASAGVAVLAGRVAPSRARVLAIER